MSADSNPPIREQLRAPIDLGRVLSRLDDCDDNVAGPRDPADVSGEGEGAMLPPMATFGGALASFASSRPSLDRGCNTSTMISTNTDTAEAKDEEDDDSVIIVQIGKRDVKPRRKATGGTKTTTTTTRKPASAARQAKIQDLLSVVSGVPGTTAPDGPVEKKARKARVAKPKVPKDPKPPKEPKVRVARPKKAKVLNITERALAAYAAPAHTASNADEGLPSCAQPTVITASNIAQFLSPTKTAAVQTDDANSETQSATAAGCAATASDKKPASRKRAVATKPKVKAKSKAKGRPRTRIIEPPPLPLLSPRSARRAIAQQRTGFAERVQVEDVAKIHLLGMSALLGVGKQLWFAANRGLEGELTDGGKSADLIAAPPLAEDSRLDQHNGPVFDATPSSTTALKIAACEPEFPPTASLSEVLHCLEAGDLSLEPKAGGDDYDLAETFMPLYSQEYLRALVGSGEPATGSVAEPAVEEIDQRSVPERDNVRSTALSQEFPVSIQHQDSSSSMIDRVSLRTSDATATRPESATHFSGIADVAGLVDSGSIVVIDDLASQNQSQVESSKSKKRKSDALTAVARAKSPRLTPPAVKLSPQEAVLVQRTEADHSPLQHDTLNLPICRERTPTFATVISSEDEDEGLDARPLAQLCSTAGPLSALSTRSRQPEVLIVPDSEDEDESLPELILQPGSPAQRRMVSTQTMAPIATSQSTLAAHGFRINKHAHVSTSRVGPVSRGVGKENLPLLTTGSPLRMNSTASKATTVRMLSTTAADRSQTVHCGVVDLSNADQHDRQAPIDLSAGDDAVHLTETAAHIANLKRPTSRTDTVQRSESVSKSPRKPRESAAEKQQRLAAAKEARAAAKLEREREKDVAKEAAKLQRVQDKADKKRQAELDRHERRLHLDRTLTRLLTTDVGMAVYYDKMLRYEPVVIDDLVDHLRQRYELKADVEEVRDYLDAKSICCARRTTRKGMARKRL